MGLILDTSLFIADEREKLNLSRWLRSRPPEPTAISAITVSELWLGVELDPNAARKKRRERWLSKVLRRIEIVPFDLAIARIHSRLWAQLLDRGNIIGPYDMIIAATAMHRVWVVATLNASEFQKVPDLQVIVP